MAKQTKSTTSIELQINPELAPSPAVIARAQIAAQAVVDAATSEAALKALLEELAGKGFKVTPAQWAALKGDGARGGRARVVLSPAQRKQLVKRAKEGATGATLVSEFGVSLATINNIKKAEGISKPRAAGKRRR